jgi:type III secretory pathway component EscR
MQFNIFSGTEMEVAIVIGVCTVLQLVVVSVDSIADGAKIPFMLVLSGCAVLVVTMISYPQLFATHTHTHTHTAAYVQHKAQSHSNGG